ncbi:DUF1279 superfamily [Basidiobolus ranarum]|uniref:DUF1279 superfamily n=1 Tax=Basidiobolus ranarum TaxID=34480 RepID=A0ABR2VTC5_9FUNG
MNSLVMLRPRFSNSLRNPIVRFSRQHGSLSQSNPVIAKSLWKSSYLSSRNVLSTFTNQHPPLIQQHFKNTASRSFRRFSTNGEASPNTQVQKPGKMKELLRKYGRTATVAYLGLSVLDFLASFALVYSGGETFVKATEEWVLQWGKRLGVFDNDKPSDVYSEEGKKKSSLTSMLVIAYTLHKLLIPIRVPLTAAVTPALAKKFQSMGWTFLVKAPKRI